MAETTSPRPTAASILSAVRDNTTSTVALVEAALERAERLADLNAFILLNREGALAAARKIDAARAAGETLPPLAGLPIVVKDNINTDDMPTTSGTPALQHARPKQNAPTVQKLLDAGAIIIGKTNMHELAFGITSTNTAPFAGPVRNPYDKRVIPGGSSGGTSAAVAADIVTCGLGTDTGGSTRIPAALCGIVGMRPSVGNGGADRRYHDTNAVVPISRTRDTIGPMGRTVADVALLDAVITGSEVATAIPLKGKRFGLPTILWDGLDREVAAIMQAACARLQEAGAELIEVAMPKLLELDELVSFSIALHEPHQDIPAYLEASGITDVTLADIASNTASADVKGIFEVIMTDQMGGAYQDAMNTHRPALQELYQNTFREHRLDALLFPTCIAPAPAIDEARGSGDMSINGGAPIPTFAGIIRNTSPGSNAGLPGLSLHAGMTADGLPVGIEIDGPVGSDRTLLGLGLSMEAVLGTAPAPKI